VQAYGLSNTSGIASCAEVFARKKYIDGYSSDTLEFWHAAMMNAWYMKCSAMKTQAWCME
jgi:hypothetical protein